MPKNKDLLINGLLFIILIPKCPLRNPGRNWVPNLWCRGEIGVPGKNIHPWCHHLPVFSVCSGQESATCLQVSSSTSFLCMVQVGEYYMSPSVIIYQFSLYGLGRRVLHVSKSHHLPVFSASSMSGTHLSGDAPNYSLRKTYLKKPFSKRPSKNQVFKCRLHFIYLYRNAILPRFRSGPFSRSAILPSASEATGLAAHFSRLFLCHFGLFWTIWTSYSCFSDSQSFILVLECCVLIVGVRFMPGKKKG